MSYHIGILVMQIFPACKGHLHMTFTKSSHAIEGIVKLFNLYREGELNITFRLNER